MAETTKAQAGHTPGPWKIATERNGRAFSAIRGADGGVVATCGFRVSVESDEDDANARLIAQAPAMLEALEELVAEHDEDCRREWDGKHGYGWPADTGGMALARQVIALARGEAVGRDS